MILALTMIVLASSIISLVAALMFPRLAVKWKLAIFAAMLLGGSSIVLGLFYYGAYWTPPDAIIIKPNDVYPGKA